MKILFVDDEKEIIELIELYLENQSVEIFKAFNGEEALRVMDKIDIDLIVADVMMPKLDGYGLVKAVRRGSQIPIIILSAKDTPLDKIHGLNIGADDYITKPFEPMEVVARINAHLRRNYKYQLHTVKEYEINNLIVNTDNCSVTYYERQVDLTAKEYKILEYLLRNINIVKTKEQIFEAVWEESYYSDDNAVRVHISNLRDKLESVMNVKIIKTIRGLGYRLSEAAHEE